MNNEPNKPIPAQELTEKELEGIAGGGNLKEKSGTLPTFTPDRQYHLILAG